MRKSILATTAMAPAALVLSLATAAPAFAGSHNHDSLEKCIHASKAVRDGEIVKVEYLSMTQDGGPTYEIELQDTDGKSWEMMCSKSDSAIYEIETEVENADDPAFAKRAKVSAEQAINTAKERFGGDPVELEYEIEFDGAPSYEIDLKEEGKEDREFKVEVDAVTGKIIEVSIEQWQIGDESDEDLGSNGESPNMQDSGSDSSSGASSSSS